MTTPPLSRTASKTESPGTQPNRVLVQWQGDRRFDVGRHEGHVARVDGDAVTGPSPVDALLGALASCVSVDVVDILAKRRTPASTFEVEVVGVRANAVPRRLTHVTLNFHIAGEGIEREQAERAIDLAITKYCSVRDSLDPNLPVEWTLDLSTAPTLRPTE